MLLRRLRLKQILLFWPMIRSPTVDVEAVGTIMLIAVDRMARAIQSYGPWKSESASLSDDTAYYQNKHAGLTTVMA